MTSEDIDDVITAFYAISILYSPSENTIIIDSIKKKLYMTCH